MVEETQRTVGRRRGGVAAALAIVALVLAWSFSTQPFGAPDEASHYLRALNLAQGHLLGPRGRYPAQPGLTPTQIAYVQADSRSVIVPNRLAPPDTQCLFRLAGDRCYEVTPTGAYPPAAYVLPALVLKLASTTAQAIWGSRAASGVLCAMLLSATVLLLWRRDGLSALGPALAISPMVLFVSSILNASSLETAAALCFTATVLALARPRRAPPDARLWSLFALSGALTVIAFQAGPGFAAASLLVGLGLGGRRLLPRRDAAAGVAWGVLVIALVVWLVYGHASGNAHTAFGIHPIRASLKAGVDQLQYVLRDAVGDFGGLTIPLPRPVVWVWWALVIALVGAAVWAGSRRERIVVVLTVLGSLAFPVLSFAWVYRHSGFGMQGRQVLPALALIPLVSGEVLAAHAAEIRRGRAVPRLAAAALVLVALLQLDAWWYDARANAGAHGLFGYLSGAGFSPPLGWALWTVVALLAVAVLAVFACGPLVTGADRRRD